VKMSDPIADAHHLREPEDFKIQLNRPHHSPMMTRDERKDSPAITTNVNKIFAAHTGNEDLTTSV